MADSFGNRTDPFMLIDPSILPLALPDTSLENLGNYVSLFEKWNDRFSFSKFNSYTDILDHLIKPSLSLAHLVDPDTHLLDIGSGPGIPGIPIKLARPELDLTIIESSSKALEFLTEVKNSLNISGLTIISGRAETLAHDPLLRNQFDTVIVRAFAPIPIVVEISAAFLKISGKLIIQSAGEISSGLELRNKQSMKVGLRFNRVGSLGPAIDGSIPVYFAIFTKVIDTPSEFPRAWNRIKKAPLWS